MVDFNNEATVGTPALDIVKVIILQRRYDVLESLEKYNKLKFQDTEPDISGFRARLITLFLEISPILKRSLGEKGYSDLDKELGKGDMDSLTNAVMTINDQLDKLNLTRFDTRKYIDTSKVELENEEKSL